MVFVYKGLLEAGNNKKEKGAGWCFLFNFPYASVKMRKEDPKGRNGTTV